MTKLTAREKILSAALTLFYNGGIHATGIDRVIEESGVAKMTLYKYFPSKLDLVLAVLERRNQQWMEWFKRRVEASASMPEERLLFLFDVLEEWFDQEDFRGCAFINASAEFAPADHPVHRCAADHMEAVRSYILDLARNSGAKDPVALAHHLALLVQGSIVVAYVVGRRETAGIPREAALFLLKAQGLNA